VAEALSGQASLIQEKINSLSSSLTAINQLREEVLQMQAVDFKKYAGITPKKYLKLVETENYKTKIHSEQF